MCKIICISCICQCSTVISINTSFNSSLSIIIGFQIDCRLLGLDPLKSNDAVETRLLLLVPLEAIDWRLITDADMAFIVSSPVF